MEVDARRALLLRPSYLLCKRRTCQRFVARTGCGPPGTAHSVCGVAPTAKEMYRGGYTGALLTAKPRCQASAVTQSCAHRCTPSTARGKELRARAHPGWKVARSTATRTNRTQHSDFFKV